MGTPCSQAGWAHTRVPGRLGACLQKEPQDRLPQILEVEVLEGACWDRVPHCTDGKTEGLAGEGLAQGVWRSANDVGRCREWVSRGETAAAEGLQGAVPPHD